MTSQKTKKFVSIMIVLTMVLTLLPATLGLAASYYSVEEFVKNVYEAGLGRAAEEEGFSYWVKELKNGRPAAEFIGYVLLDSPEFKEKYENISNEEFAKKAYEIVFNREADEEGLEFWISEMEKGGSQRYVIVAMLYAPTGEFQEFCDKVGIRLGSLKVPADEYPGDEPVELEVEEVSANNLKTFVVELNKAVDEDTVSTSTVQVTDRTLEDVILSEDGKTITGVFATNIPQSTEIEVKLDGIKSLDGKEEIKDFKQKLVVNDTQIPVVMDAVALNAKQIKLQFNEPVNFNKAAYEVLSNVKIDGRSVVAKTSQDYGKNTVVLTLTTAQKAGSYKLEVSGIYDYASLKIAKAEFTIVVYEDSEAPSIIDAKATKVNQIEVTFNEAIDRLSNGSFGTFKVNGTEISRANVEEVSRSAGTKFRLNLSSELDLAATVEVKVAYKGQKDMAGNEVKDEKIFTFKVPDDTALPTVSLTVESGNKLTLTFSKPMLKNTGTIKVFNSNNKQIASFSVASVASQFEKNDTVLKLNASDVGLSNVDVADYTLNIKDMKDATIRKNLLPEQNISFTSKDTKAPEVLDVYTVKAGSTSAADTITFYFSEAMDEDTLKNLSNYVLEGTSNRPLSIINGVKDPVVSSDKKSVTITYNGAASFSTERFTIYGVKDEAGNLASMKTGVGKADTVALSIVSAKAIAVNKVEVEFNKQIYSVDPSALKVTGPNFSSNFVSASINTSDATKVAFTTDKDLDADAGKYSVVALNNNLIKDVAGNTLLQGVTHVLTDKIAPEFDSLEAGNKITNSGNDNVFTVKFTEPITVANAAGFLADIVVRDSNGKRIATADLQVVGADGSGTDNLTNAKTVVVRIKPSAGLAYGSETIQVSFPIVNNIKDGALNSLVEGSEKSVTVTIANVGVTISPSQVTPGVAPTPGTQEVNKLTVTSGATAAGVITVTFNDGTLNVSKDITVTAGQTAAQVATAIYNAFNDSLTGYTVTNPADGEVVFTNNTAQADKTVDIQLLAGSTGVAIGVSQVTAGVASTSGTQEVNKLTVTSGATVTGIITVTFNDGTLNVSKDITVTAGQTAAQVATAIYNAFNNSLTGYTVTNPADGEVVFTNNTAQADKNVIISLN